MDIMTETSKRIEELEEENKELNEKLDKCRKLLRMAVNELEEQMSNLCETVGDMDSVYSPCLICANEELCRRNAVGIVKWIHADEVRSEYEANVKANNSSSTVITEETEYLPTQDEVEKAVTKTTTTPDNASRSNAKSYSLTKVVCMIST